MLKGKNPVNNIFQRRINIIKLKGLNTDKAHNASEPEFNFVKKDKRFMNKILDKLSSEKNGYYFQEKNFSLFNIAENSKYNTALKRQEYSTILKNENEKRVVIKRLNHFNQFFYKLEMSQKQRKNYSYSTDLKNKLNSSENQQFNSKLFFKEIDNLDFEKFNNYYKNKYKFHNKHYSKIREIVSLIISVTMEGYLYQAETKKDLIDIPFYLKLIKLFLKNKRIERKLLTDDFITIKEKGKVEEEIDSTKIKLTKEELLFLKDYNYYLGFWSKAKIIEKEILGKRLDYKLLFKNHEEYEPTEMELEDLTIPTKLISNFDFGDLISEFIEYKYSQTKQSNNDEEISKMPKWFYIPYKVVLIGESFFSNKYIAQQFNKKYPNLKIYSAYKLLYDYCSYYKQILSDHEEDKIKSKSK